jgi:hypothetical protein
VTQNRDPVNAASGPCQCVCVSWLFNDAVTTGRLSSVGHSLKGRRVHTDERTQVHSARPSLAVTHPSTNRGRRALTSVNETVSEAVYLYINRPIGPMYRPEQKLNLQTPPKTGYVDGFQTCRLQRGAYSYRAGDDR